MLIFFYRAFCHSSKSNIKTRKSWNHSDSSFRSVALIRSTNSKSTYGSLTDHWILTKLHCVYYVPLEKLRSMRFTVREYKDVINSYTLSSGNRNGSLHHCYAKKKNMYYIDVFVLTIKKISSNNFFNNVYNFLF